MLIYLSHITGRKPEVVLVMDSRFRGNDSRRSGNDSRRSGMTAEEVGMTLDTKGK